MEGSATDPGLHDHPSAQIHEPDAEATLQPRV